MWGLGGGGAGGGGNYIDMFSWRTEWTSDGIIGNLCIFSGLSKLPWFLHTITFDIHVYRKIWVLWRSRSSHIVNMCLTDDIFYLFMREVKCLEKIKWIQIWIFIFMQWMFMHIFIKYTALFGYIANSLTKIDGINLHFRQKSIIRTKN